MIRLIVLYESVQREKNHSRSLAVCSIDGRWNEVDQVYYTCLEEYQYHIVVYDVIEFKCTQIDLIKSCLCVCSHAVHQTIANNAMNDITLHNNIDGSISTETLCYARHF